MGMHDYLKISTDKLPISDADKLLLGANPGWQTKDFECILSVAEITDEGKLRFQEFESEWDENATCAWGELHNFKGALVEKNHRWVDIPMHGYVNFYASDKNGAWWEFNAKFTDGVLVAIEGGKEERNQTKE